MTPERQNEMRWTEKGHKELCEVTGLSSILVVAWTTQVYPFVRMHSTLHLKSAFHVYRRELNSKNCQQPVSSS